MRLEDIKGVGEATAKKLRKAGYTSVEALAVTPIKELQNKTSLEYKTAKKIVDGARELVGIRFVTAKELWEMHKGRLRITTGSKALDKLIGGGIETQAITELSGQYGTGKTQICHTLCVTVQMPKEMGGLEGAALYFDTEGTFSPNRIYQIAQNRGLDPEEALKNVIVSRVYTSDHQMFLLENAFDKCAENNVRLVIVDSVISHFRGEYIGRDLLAERQQKLNQYMHKLLRLAEVLNLAVVVTNQAQANPIAYYGAPENPTGGNILAHASNTRLWLRRARGSTRVAKLIDSPYLPEGECLFRITEKGIEDVAAEEN